MVPVCIPVPAETEKRFVHTKGQQDGGGISYDMMVAMTKISLDSRNIWQN